MKRLLIIGCGDVAMRAIPLLAHRYRIFSLVRSCTLLLLHPLIT